MVVQTNLGEDILRDNENIKYDSNIKNILAYKPVLAHIFKETVDECRDMSYSEIESSIEGNIEIDVVGLNPGTTNLEKISGNTQENAINGEGKITFDIRTFIRVPKVDDAIGVKLLIDVEAQKDDTPGYDISERAIFYCCRMISSQLGVEFTNSAVDPVKYSNLKKVYSIWICTETSKKRANTIERYSIKKDVYPQKKGNIESRYDLMEAVIVNISEDHDDENSESIMIQMLTELFNEKLDSKEKLQNLKSKYGIPTTVEFEKEVTNMTVFAANLISKGQKEGEIRGRIMGIVETEIENCSPREATVQKLIRKFNLSEEVANKYYDEYALQTV